jgi:hypothetical protein
MAELNLDWKGDAVKAKVKAAAIAGVNKTMGQAVNHAKRNHGWKNRSGILEGGIGVDQLAAPYADGVRGTWGVFDIAYALAQELGAIIRPVKAKALAIPQPGGGVRFVKQVTIPAQPYLRPAADAWYPSLGTNIRKAMAAGGGDG